jgi:hypothetical protein
VPRNPYPESIEELEHDDEVYGPLPPQEEHRTLVELSKRYLLLAAEHIADSRALLAKIDRLPRHESDAQNNLSNA